MTEGCDYAFSQPSPSGLYAAGKRFAMRYVGPGTDDKHLHADERDQIWAAGLDICLLAEGAIDSATGGYSVGVQHAQSALAGARALGAPDWVPIYFAVDFDVTSAQWPTVVAYFNGVASVIGRSRVGIYGSVRAIQWAARDGVATWFFQTYAWSAGQWFSGNHVEQYQNGVSMAGGTVDLCRARQSNYGQWSSGGAADMTDDESRRLFNIDGMLWYGFVNGSDVPPGGMRLGAGAGTPNAEPIPVWAVEHIKALEAKVAELEAKIDALQPASGVAAHTHEGGTSGPVA